MINYHIREELELAAPLDEVWDYISSPLNLKEITPPFMGFEIKSNGLPAKIFSGLMVAYRVRPVLGIKVRWLTEISRVEEPSFFVDEQRSGPFARWHHEHRVNQTEKGVLMSDLVTYRLPLGPLGILAHWLFVKRRLKKIFQYREEVLTRRFGRP